jgi:antitoxin VapB
MAALNIKDPEVHELAVELARRTRRSLSEAVKDSLRESIARQRVRQTDAQRVVERVTRIAQRIASRSVLDPRAPDEIIGYNDFGVPERSSIRKPSVSLRPLFRRRYATCRP